MQQPSETYANTEQRARATRHWETVIRPQMAAKEQAPQPEDPHAALAHLKSEGWGNVRISDAIKATLPNMKKGPAA